MLLARRISETHAGIMVAFSGTLFLTFISDAKRKTGARTIFWLNVMLLHQFCFTKLEVAS